MRRKFSFGLLLLLPILQPIVNPKFFWAYHILLLIVILFEEKVLVKSKNYFFLFFIGIPLLWATIFSINDNPYLIIQSLFYLTIPLIFTFIGMQISRITTPEIVLKYLIYSGTIGALGYIIFSFYSFGLKALINPYAVRELYAWGSITNVIALIIVLFSKESNIILFKKRKNRNIIAFINFLALYLTASRTYYLVFLIFLFIFLYNRNKKLTILTGTLFAIGIVVLLSTNIDNKLMNKIQSTAAETSMGEYTSDAEINTKYRGFETFMAFKTYVSGTPINLIFGHGLEKQVDLGTYVMLGDSYRKVIPVLHNGYIYLLIKEGLLGLIFFLIFLRNIFKLKNEDNTLKFIHKIVKCSGITLLVTNIVIGTFISPEMSILWIFFGIYIVHVEKNNKMNYPAAEQRGTNPRSD